MYLMIACIRALSIFRIGREGWGGVVMNMTLRFEQNNDCYAGKLRCVSVNPFPMFRKTNAFILKGPAVQEDLSRIA
jgi:hypothetical protein